MELTGQKRSKGPISTQEKFPRTEHFPKIALLKVENFQLQNFSPTENLCRPITSYKIFFLRKIIPCGMALNGLSFSVEKYTHCRARNNGRSTINDRQEIVFDRRRSNVAVHLDRQEIYLTIV